MEKEATMAKLARLDSKHAAEEEAAESEAIKKRRAEVKGINAEAEAKRSAERAARMEEVKQAGIQRDKDSAAQAIIDKAEHAAMLGLGLGAEGGVSDPTTALAVLMEARGKLEGKLEALPVEDRPTNYDAAVSDRPGAVGAPAVRSHSNRRKGLS